MCAESYSHVEALSEIFRTTGQPTVTYVERMSGEFERDLDRALSERGQLCLVTGPSKTGKTTLYMEVLRRRNEVPLIVRCDRSLTTSKLWLRALEEVDFERVERRSSTRKITTGLEVEVGGKLGWKWLAEATSKFKGSINGGVEESEVRSRILSDPGADTLIPILKETSFILIIEDFHYLNDNEKSILFEQWKRFTDNEISVIVLSTTHRSIEIANSNKDLIGRITQINIGNWDVPDLRKIAKKGFAHIGIPVRGELITTIAQESVGLPILVQQSCLTLVTRNGAEYRSDVAGKTDLVTDESISDSFHIVANSRYAQFQEYYSTIVRGPRERARKYQTYEIILGCFALDPIKFALNKGEILDRISELGLSDSATPKPASVQSTLTALARFQKSRGLELLEWQPNRQMLHIIEPSFLFFVRWREKKQAATTFASYHSRKLAINDFLVSLRLFESTEMSAKKNVFSSIMKTKFVKG